MKTATLIMTLLLICMFPAFSWDRYSNEVETYYGTYSFQKIMSYYFYVSSTSTFTFETQNTTGDTYMYLWSRSENVQIAKDDDAGVGHCSKITATLKPGNYAVFIRSYHNNSPSYCDLYKNGSKVISQGRYSGYSVYVSHLPAETLIKTTNLSPGSDTFCLLLNASQDMIGYNDDYYDYASGIVAVERPSFFVIGAFNDDSEGTCEVHYLTDSHVEYLSLCGSEDRHVRAGNSFKDHFNSGSYYYTYVLESGEWMFNNSRMSYIDGVDLLFINSHGDPGKIETYQKVWTDFTSPAGSSGSGHRTSNTSGDLEYAAFMSCKTVMIGSETSWDWLKTWGWQSYYDGSNKIKGFFDGVHIVVGYHTNQTVVTRAFLDHESSWYEAKYFADNLDAGQSIWNAWKNANIGATDTTHHWLWYPHVNLGEVSSIHITPQKDETLANHNSTDYTLGDSNYYFGWRKNHYYYK